MGKWSDQFKKHCDKAQNRLEITSYNATVLLFAAIVFDTPWDHEVLEPGGARGGWNTSTGDGNYTITGRKDPTGTAAIAEIQQNVKAGYVNWLTNSVHYIVILEYGLFKQQHSRRVVNHYSSQATAGFLSINVRRFNLYLEQGAQQAMKK